MMKALMIFSLSVFHFVAFAQAYDYDSIGLGNAEECKTAQPAVLAAANYMLSTPFESNDAQRLRSLSFIIKWMTATPDFHFGIDESVTKLSKGNDDALGLYMAAMTKYCLENPADANDATKVKVNSVTSILNYAEDSKNNFKMTKNMKKLSEAKAKGELAKNL